MRFFILLLPFFIFVGCDSIGLSGSYPAIYSQNDPECGCDGVLYIIQNPNHSMQKVTIVQTRISGTAPAKRKTISMLLQPKVKKKLGCSEINLFIQGRSEFCDTHQSFYVKTYTEVKQKD